MSASMSPQDKRPRLLKRVFSLNQFTIAVLVVAVLFAIIALITYAQILAERNLFDPSGQKEQYEIAKLAAEIRQIRSDTSGSLFWIKLVGLLFTIAGALGGYLLGQHQNTKKRLKFEDDKEQKRLAFEDDKEQKRLKFEHRKDVDTAYQSIVQGLSEESPVLRATAAVKLGAILESFPTEWDVPDDRQQQMIRLTKEVLAAALALEKNPKVLKTLTIALVLHKPGHKLPPQGKVKYADASNLDLSQAKANEAYWARVDFTKTDFYKASLARTSLRLSVLDSAQFYLTDLSDAILAGAQGEDTTLKFCNLRNVNLTNASLVRPNFEGAKVHGVTLAGASIRDPIDAQVDISKAGDRPKLTSVHEWLEGYEYAEPKGLKHER